MSKKQSSVEMLWSLIPLHCQIEIEERFRAIEHARQMHREEIKLELPTDEEIEKEFTMGNQIFIDRISGAKWMRDKIKGDRNSEFPNLS